MLTLPWGQDHTAGEGCAPGVYALVLHAPLSHHDPLQRCCSTPALACAGPRSQERAQVRFMSASGDPRADWLAAPVWDDLRRLESRHRELQREHDVARRRL